MEKKKTQAQSTIEFTFAMIVILFLIYGMVRVFRWVGMDLAQRRWAQDNSLLTNWPELPLGVLSPFNADFYRVQSIDAVYHGNVAE